MLDEAIQGIDELRREVNDLAAQEIAPDKRMAVNSTAAILANCVAELRRIAAETN